MDILANQISKYVQVGEAAFEHDFMAAVADTCGVDVGRVVIKSIMAASVLVTLDILPSPDGSGPDPAAAFKSLVSAGVAMAATLGVICEPHCIFPW